MTSPSESYEAAVFLLRQIPDLPDGVIHPDYIDFPTIIGDRQWSSGEWVVVMAALDIWNGNGGATIGQLLRDLDDAYFAAVLQALMLRRPNAGHMTRLVTR